MVFSKDDIELSRKHFEERLKVTLGPVEMKEIMDDPLRRDTYTIIDVRNRDAYMKEHVPGAINIPEEELAMRVGELSKDREIIVYCWTLVCHLAAHAGLTLAQNGFFVRELEGGIDQWKVYDMPLASGAMAGAR